MASRSWRGIGFYLATYVIVWGYTAPLAAVPFLFPLIPQSITHTTADQILNDAILVNGIVIGFVVIVLDRTATEAWKSPGGSDERKLRVAMAFMDGGILFYSVREIVQEMLALAAVQGDLQPLVGNAVFIPIRFLLYMGFRFAAIMLVSDSRR